MCVTLWARRINFTYPSALHPHLITFLTIIIGYDCKGCTSYINTYCNTLLYFYLQVKIGLNLRFYVGNTSPPPFGVKPTRTLLLSISIPLGVVGIAMAVVIVVCVCRARIRRRRHYSIPMKSTFEFDARCARRCMWTCANVPLYMCNTFHYTLECHCINVLHCDIFLCLQSECWRGRG